MQIHPDDSPCEYSPSAFLEIPTRGGILMTATLSSPSSSSLVPSTPGLFCPEQEHNFWDSVADWPGLGNWGNKKREKPGHLGYMLDMLIDYLVSLHNNPVCC